MTRYTLTLTGEELSEVVLALRNMASDSRQLAKNCGDIELLADHKARWRQEGERLDALATRLNLSPTSA